MMGELVDYPDSPKHIRLTYHPSRTQAERNGVVRGDEDETDSDEEFGAYNEREAGFLLLKVLVLGGWIVCISSESGPGAMH